MVTGASLRAAREAAGMTQQQVAEAAGVSLRTARYWEEKDRVPNKYWATLMDFLPGSRVDLAKEGEIVDGDDEEKAVAKMRGKLVQNRAKLLHYENLGLSEDEIVQNHLRVVEGVEAMLDTITLAHEIGVSPQLLRDGADLTVGILTDAGTAVFITNDDRADPVRHALYRAFGVMKMLEDAIRMNPEGLVLDD